MRRILRECQANFGDPPRSLTFGEKRDYRIWPPIWCLLSGDPLLKIYWDQKKLRDRGRVVWAHLVQANSLLFEPGHMDHPANIVYDPSTENDRVLDLLGDVAQQIYELKGTRPREKDLAECSRWVTNERQPIVDATVPARLSRGREIVFSTVMIHRKHLPGGYLSGSAFPLIINPEETPSAMVLPHFYWPDGVDALGT